MTALRKLVFLMACMSTLLLLSAPAFGGVLSFTFDENGNGQITTTSGSTNLPYYLATDPVSGQTTLFYDLLPFTDGLVYGDLRVHQLGGSVDIVRFGQLQNGTQGAFVFSDAGGPDLADTGTPPLWFDATTGFPFDLAEVDLGGGKFGVSYHPDSGHAGYQTGNPDTVTYNFISDTPEPATYLVTALGLLLLSRRKRN
jgi:hypothetical protein